MKYRILYIILLLITYQNGIGAQSINAQKFPTDTLPPSFSDSHKIPILIAENSLQLFKVTGLSPKSEQQFFLSDYPSVADQIVTYYENHGYPFASVHLESDDSTSESLNFRLLIDTNRYIIFDSIILKGDVKLSTQYLYPYLGLKRHTTYDERIMKSVPSKLAELPFATVIRESGVSFVKNKAYLYIYLDPRKTNQFDGYLGIVPVNEQTGKVSINGEINLALQNLFHYGESIALTWRSTERYSQYLNISTKIPYLVHTRLGIASNFLLNKQDTSFLTLNYHIGLSFAFASNSFLQPYFDYTSSSILNSNLISFDSDTGYIDYHKTLYGLIFRYRKLDYLFNPHKGFDFETDISAGRRIIIQNSSVDSALYGGITMNKTSFKITSSIDVFIPAGKYFVIVPCIKCGSLLAGPHYYNELIDIGGASMIRGFNENELRASTYLITSAEVRYLFGKQSYLHAFFDFGAYEQQLSRHYFKDFPYGFGAGISFATKAGMFYFDYALGKQLNNPISLKAGKIHFGVRVSF